MTIVKKGKILRDDLEIWDGRDTQANRQDSTGGTITGLKIGTEVDVLAVYGQGTDYTVNTINQAVIRNGSDNRTLIFNPGTWTIDANLTIGSNFVCRIPAGCVFNVSSGVTLTFSGPVIQDHQTVSSGSGTVAYNGTRYFNGDLNITGDITQTGTYSGLDLNGTEIILDADGDTSLTSDTDDQIDVKIGGSDLIVIDASSIDLSLPINETKGADIASATTTDIGAATGNFVDITGTTTITGLGTVQAGTRRVVQFDGSLTLTHNATSLILPGGANIITNAGDTAEFISLGSGNWLCTDYTYKIIPSFSVHKNGSNQAITGGALEKITWPTEDYDTNSNFASSTFTPTVAGKYHFTSGLTFAVNGDLDRLQIALYKNGTEYKSITQTCSGANDQSIAINCYADANGSTDYFEIYATNITSADTLNGTVTDTWFMGSKV